MIEIPEAVVLARQIQETLGGKRIANVEAGDMELAITATIHHLAAGAPRPACGAEIRKESCLGGSMPYCPSCQPRP